MYQKRNRTTFNQYQLAVLEEAFKQNCYPNLTRRNTLALKTNLDSSRVQVWFQNRRAKHKKQVNLAMRCLATSHHQQQHHHHNHHQHSPEIMAAAAAHEQQIKSLEQCATVLQQHQQMALDLHLNPSDNSNNHHQHQHLQQQQHQNLLQHQQQHQQQQQQQQHHNHHHHHHLHHQQQQQPQHSINSFLLEPGQTSATASELYDNSNTCESNQMMNINNNASNNNSSHSNNMDQLQVQNEDAGDQFFYADQSWPLNCSATAAAAAALTGQAAGQQQQIVENLVQIVDQQLCQNQNWMSC